MRLGAVIACGSKDAWNNTFEAMCENYFHDVEVGMQAELLKAGYGMNTERIDSFAQPMRQPEMVRKKLIDGVFLVGGLFGDSVIKMLANANLPAVVIGRDYPGVDCVTTDYQEAVYQGVKHLLERGHRDLLYISGPERTPTSSLKDAGYRKALAEFSMHGSTKRHVRSEFSGEGGYWATKLSYEKGLRPTAIFAASDTIAAGALGYLYEQRLRVPDDVSVAAFERSMLTEYLTPALTCLDINKDELGRQAALMMLRRLENPHGQRERVVVPFSLRYGASVRTIEAAP